MPDKIIDEQRRRLLGECRTLVKKISKSDQDAAAQPSEPIVSEPKVCECCQKTNISENMTKIDSGQFLCLQCLQELRRV